jgi:hypothetical protein
LEQYSTHLTVVEFAERYLQNGRASTRAIANASSKACGTNNTRKHLGAFGWVESSMLIALSKRYQ